MRALAAPIREWVDVGLGLIYPPVCQICEKFRATAAEGFVCGTCRKDVQPLVRPFCRRCGLPFHGEVTTKFECANCADVAWHFTYARAAAISQGPVRSAILRYKYQRALWFESFLADLLVGAAVLELKSAKATQVVPVPLHPLKEREREFNQAVRLGGYLATALEIPLNTKLLRRVSFTVTQTRLSRADRARNMHRVFALTPGTNLAGQRLVLVDDVFTTGATTNACAKVLRAAGAAEVCVWTVARGI